MSLLAVAAIVMLTVAGGGGLLWLVSVGLRRADMMMCTRCGAPIHHELATRMCTQCLDLRAIDVRRSR